MSPADLACALQAHFPTWQISPCPYDSAHWCDLVRADGAALRVYAGPGCWVKDGRCEIAGVFPKTKDGQLMHWDAAPKISCAIGRGPKTIAAEISRRLLPNYLARFDHMKALVAKADENADEAEMVAKRLCAQLGDDTHSESARRGDEKRIYTSLDHVYGMRVRPGYGDNPTCVDVELLRLPPELAAEVLALVQAAEARSHAAVRVEAPASVSREIEAEEIEERAPLLRRIA